MKKSQNLLISFFIEKSIVKIMIENIKDFLKNKNYFSKYKIFICCLVLIPLVTYNFSDSNNLRKKEIKIKIFKAVIDSLVKYGIDTETVLSLVNYHRTHFNEKYTRLNFGMKPNFEFSNKISQKSINQIKRFIKEHQLILAKAEENFGVQKEIIAIILWIETKLGEVLGNHHLLSVFFSMAMSSHETFLQRYLVDSLKNGTNNKSYDDIIQRARRKESYALQQLQALIEMHRRGYFDVRELYGSYAGAFGIPQFVPTSYLQFAIDGNGDKKIDLFNLEDAIFSVANYLHQNGWNRFDTNSYSETLYKYNKNQQYVATIMNIFFLINKSK